MASEETKVGVVGAGLIGMSWAGLFSAFGYETIVYDPHLKQQSVALRTIQDIWASLDLLFDNLSYKRDGKFSNNVE